MAAAPGVGKTIFATNLTTHTPVPTLYFSADSDEWTVRSRVASILTGHTLEQVDRNLNDPAWDQHYAGYLSRVDHVDWCYKPDIDTEFIALRLQAHAELRGEYPHLIVVDNLGNTVVDQDNEYAELRGTCRELQQIARTTNAHVLATHHVKGAKENGDQPIRQGDLLGNISKVSEIVLGLSRGGDDVLTLSVAKNRGGRSGQLVQLGVDYSRSTIGGWTR